MKIAVAIDSFKGSLSTFECADAVEAAAKRVFSGVTVEKCPLADGGEGTVRAIVSATGGKLVNKEVCGPLGDRVIAEYGILPEKKTAVIEMAAAAGITLVEEAKRDPMITTTYGVGELIRDAIETHGARKFIVGIGGSATNDGGTGMLSALGFEFLDESGKPIPHGAKGLADLKDIRTEHALPALSDCEFLVACDVNNPLCGERGCSAVFGPQKGATPKTVKLMDASLSAFAALTGRVLGASHENDAGAGAAGGLGFAFLSYLSGKLTPGVTLVMDATSLYEKIKDADLVVTGEGRLDGQTVMGKAPIGVAKVAKKYGKTVIAFAGCVTEDAVLCNENGIDAFFPILRAPISLSDAMNKENAYKNLMNTAEQAFRLYKAANQ